MIENLAGDGDGEIAHSGEVREALPPRRMVLTKDHVPLRSVQAMPGAHPALEQPVPIAVRMATLHLLEQGDRPQAGPAFQQRQNLALPDPVQRIRHLTAPLPASVLLRRQAWIALNPTRGPLADPRLGGGDKLRAVKTELHVIPGGRTADSKVNGCGSALCDSRFLLDGGEDDDGSDHASWLI